MFKQLVTGLAGGVLMALQVVHAQANFELVSLTSSNQPPSSTPAGSSNQAAVTPDGRYVVFEGSFSGLVSNPTITGNSQIYLRDRDSDTTELISQSTGGVAANGTSSGRPSISNDGCRVVFQSDASNLVANDLNGSDSVFLRNRCTNPQTTTMVDVMPNGSPGNGVGKEPRISGDGRTAVFVSSSTGLVTGLLDHSRSICNDALYLRNLDTGVTRALMRPDGGCLPGREPDISYDGNRVAFWKHPYEPIISSDTNIMWDIYLYDDSVGQSSYRLVSATASGVPHSQDDGKLSGEIFSSISAPSISQDGGIVAFRSCGYGLVPNLQTTGNSIVCQVYVKDTYTGEIAVASASSSNVMGNNHSGNGGYRPGISSDGQYVTFNTSATNLVVSPTNFVVRNVFTRDTTGFTHMSFSGDNPDISSSGRYLTVYSGDKMDSHFDSRGWFLIDLGIPYKPTITKLTPMGTEMKVSFTPSALSNPIAASNYGAVCEGTDGSSGSTSGTASPLIVAQLKPGVTYKCSVIAFNPNVNSSVYSSPVTKKLTSDLTPILMLLLD